MPSATSFTSTQLLDGLRNADDQERWQELDRRMRPILFGVAQRMGLDADAAADVVQETFLMFLRLYRDGRYDRNRGGLRSWIVGIARYRILESRRQRGRQPERLPTLEAAELEAESDLFRIWDEEARAALLGAALDQLEKASEFAPRTLDVFRRVCVDGKTPSTVAQELSMSENAVYQAKYKCLHRLRSVMAQLEKTWELAG